VPESRGNVVSAYLVANNPIPRDDPSKRGFVDINPAAHSVYPDFSNAKPFTKTLGFGIKSFDKICFKVTLLSNPV